MTQFQRLARGAALAVAAACVFAGALGGWPSPGEARKSKSQPAAAQAGAQPAGPQKGGQGGGDGDDKSQAQVAGRQAYDTGLKEFANGHLQQAVDQFTTALNSGGLLAPQMAKALYTRGLAYKKLNRPSLAIADLTSALWLKNGLSGDDKDKATAERAEAYQAAGIADPGNLPPVRKAVADAGAIVNDSSAGLSAAAIAQAATPNSGSGSGTGGSAATRQDTSSEAAQDAARARAAYTSSSSDNGLQSAASATVVGSGAAAPGQQASAGSFGWSSPAEAAAGNSATVSSSASAPSLTETAPAPAASTSSMSTLTGVFSSLFGGGSSAPAAAPPPSSASVMTASTSPVEPATSSWSETTTTQAHGTGSVASAATEKVSKKSKRPEQVALATPSKPLATPKGKYKVHIAALRSRAEAEALAQQIVAQHGADLQNHAPTVDEAVIGSMGTFYRVRIPGYASQDEPRGLCNKLRSSGLDCLVVTN